MSPANYLALEAGYIPTSSSFLNSPLPKEVEGNSFFEVGFKDFKAIEADKGGKIVAFREPVSMETDRLVSAFYEAFKLHLYEPKSSFKDFLKTIKTAISVN